MNCPYCDETIHAMAKFCPKCGLPLKDDATVMGAYVQDGDGPNWAIIGGGAAAIIVVALGIGWLGSKKDASPDSVQRQLVSQAPSAPQAFGGGTFGQFAPAGFTGFSSGRSSMTDEKPKWAYVPPSNPAPQAPVMSADAGPVLPPSQVLQMNPQAMAHQPQPQFAMAVRPSIPDAPALPPDVPPNLPPSETLDPTSIILDNNPPPPAIEDASGTYIYDPVQGRYAINPERKPRSSAATRRSQPGVLPGNFPAPGNSPGTFNEPAGAGLRTTGPVAQQ